MYGLREKIMAQCSGRLTPINLPTPNASQQLVAGSSQRVAIAFTPSSILAAFNTRPLTSSADGIAPQSGWSQLLTLDIWTHGQIVQMPWFTWALISGTGYFIEVTYNGRKDLLSMINDIAGGPSL